MINKYVWNEYRWKAQCLFMELPPKLRMRVRILARRTDATAIYGGLLLWIQGFRGLLNALGQCRPFLSRLLVLSHTHLEVVLLIITQHLLLFSGAGNRSGVGEEEQSKDLGEGERVWLTGQGGQGGRQDQRSL